MSYWNHESEPEDGGETQPHSEAVSARRWLRKEVSKQIIRNPLYGALADLEHAASGYFLGTDYDDDTSDVDEMGPY